ncbi:hypothetical protein SVIO_060590 [Streptomyces violaceusniger]|uniref:Uncharacterized protein n=1 Tax=Streptomyces violaceusniger TaxID=68280 RepID=A0A4D4L8C1_STRVO|nr:hypothetical protein SVIO_060590 [Streptomyces violaceusniger]
MDGGADPAQFVRNGAVVGLQADPRPVGLDPQRLVRQHPDRRAARLGEGGKALTRQEEVPAVRGLADDGVLGASVMLPAGRWTTAYSSVRSAMSTR